MCSKMDTTTDVISDEHLNKLFEKLAAQVTGSVYELHFMRKSVEHEEEMQRVEEAKIQDLQRQLAETARNMKRAESEQAIASSACQKEMMEFMKEANQNCATALEAEVNGKLMVALTNLIAEREKEVTMLRQASSVRQVGDPVAANVAARRIVWNAKEFMIKVQDLLNEINQLKGIHRDARNIVHTLLAFKEEERISNLQIKSTLATLNAQTDRLPERLATNRVRKCPAIQSTSGSIVESREAPGRSSAIRKELELEKFRGAKLVKELCEIALQASDKAASRENWLEEVRLSDVDSSTQE